MNTPNKISLVRILLIPVIIFFFFATFIPNGINYFVASGLFILAAYTDALDGHIARKYNLVTTLGKFLDSIADKLLATVTIILIICSNIISPNYLGSIILIIIVSRDLIIDMLRQISASKNVIIAADWFGKIKTIFIDIALPLLLVAIGLNVIIPNSMAFNIVYYIGLSLLVISTILSLLSGINYIVKNRKLLISENTSQN